MSPQGSCWDPNSTYYSEHEEALVDVSGEIIDAPERNQGSYLLKQQMKKKNSDVMKLKSL